MKPPCECKLYCRCGCANLPRHRRGAFCVWCHHAYERGKYSRKAEKEHFIRWCPGCPRNMKRPRYWSTINRDATFGPKPPVGSAAAQRSYEGDRECGESDLLTFGSREEGDVTESEVAKQVIAAKRMIAAVDAAEAKAAAEGRQLTDAELKKLGYVEEEGGTWHLPIPVHISKIILGIK